MLWITHLNPVLTILHCRKTQKNVIIAYQSSLHLIIHINHVLNHIALLFSPITCFICILVLYAFKCHVKLHFKPHCIVLQVQQFLQIACQSIFSNFCMFACFLCTALRSCMFSKLHLGPFLALLHTCLLINVAFSPCWPSILLH